MNLIKWSTLVVAVLLLLAVIFWSKPAAGSDCAAHAPWGLPQTALSNSVLICRTGLALLHDNRAKIAAWVSYVLTRDRVLSCAPRVDQFSADPALTPGARAEVSDYRRSGFDMGHMAPNADQSWSRRAQQESFYLSNAAPQLPSLNRGLWRELETVVRSWAYQRRSVTVYVGSVYRQDDHTIGANRVVIPRAFYKIVIDNHRQQSLAFLVAHNDNHGGNIAYVQTTVAHVSDLTGIDFPVPDNPSIKHELWSYNTRALARARSQHCRAN